MGLCISRNSDSYTIKVDDQGNPSIHVHFSGRPTGKKEELTKRMEKMSALGLKEVKRRGFEVPPFQEPAIKPRIFREPDGSLSVIPGKQAAD